MNPQSTKERVVRKHLPKLKHAQKPDNYELIYKPKTQEEFVLIADELYAWAKMPTSTNINAFAISKKISPYRFKRFQNDYFQEMLELVKYMVADRNRNGVIAQAFDKDLYFKELYLMDRDYKEAEDDKISKRVEGVKQTLGNITIVDHMLKRE